MDKIRQKLFNYFADEHDIQLLDGDFNEIEAIISEREAWKPYPENKPEDERDYLVQYEDSDCSEVGYFDNGKEWNTPSDGFYGEVIAFRELPAPYRKEIKL